MLTSIQLRKSVFMAMGVEISLAHAGPASQQLNYKTIIDLRMDTHIHLHSHFVIVVLFFVFSDGNSLLLI